MRGYIHKLGLLLLSAALALQLSACGSAPAPSPTPEPTPAPQATATPSPGPNADAMNDSGFLREDIDSLTTTDDLDREVTFTARPERVAILTGSFADVWCLAGGKDTIVAAADDTWTQFDLGLPDTVERLGAIKEPNLEVLLAVEPDLVIASAKTEAAVALLPTLEAAGIPVLYYDISNVQDYLDMLSTCTALTGQRENYDQYGLAVMEQIEQARDRARAHTGEPETVLYVRATGSTCKVKNSQGTVLGEMLADLGTVNIADSADALLEELSMEVILASDPDKIFIVMQGSDQEKVQNTLEQSLISNPAWQQLTAVQDGEVYYMDQALYNVKPNARWGEAYEGLADILYGEE